jgi:hypothetical protein
MIDDARLTKAARLVLDGRLERRRDGSWWVESSQPGVFYRADTSACACPDWWNRQPEGGCKHVLAIKLFCAAFANIRQHSAELDSFG